jgi:opacity protein-like surface antigen
MLKKLILASTVIALTTGVAMANPAPYVGAGLGLNVNTSATANYRDMPFNLLAGYGGLIDQSIYLAGELNVTAGSAEISRSYANLKTTYSYGVSVLPGLMLNDRTLAFVRAGLVNTRFSDLGKTKAGAQFGLGLQTGLTQNVDLRGEYDYTAYRSFHANSGEYISSPRTDGFNFALVYKID